MFSGQQERQRIKVGLVTLVGIVSLLGGQQISSAWSLAGLLGTVATLK